MFPFQETFGSGQPAGLCSRVILYPSPTNQPNRSLGSAYRRIEPWTNRIHASWTVARLETPRKKVLGGIGGRYVCWTWAESIASKAIFQIIQRSD